MAHRFLAPFKVKKGLRAISFHAGLGAGLLAVGAYLAAINHHWLATAVFIIAAMAIASIPLRLPRIR